MWGGVRDRKQSREQVFSSSDQVPAGHPAPALSSQICLWYKKLRTGDITKLRCHSKKTNDSWEVALSSNGTRWWASCHRRQSDSTERLPEDRSTERATNIPKGQLCLKNSRNVLRHSSVWEPLATMTIWGLFNLKSLSLPVKATQDWDKSWKTTSRSTLKSPNTWGTA